MPKSYALLLSLLSIFMINPVYADTAQPAPQGGGFSLLMMFAVFILFMYWVVWRPQSKRTKEHRALLNSLVEGDEVITTGGILGRITKLMDQYIVLSLNDQVNMVIQRNAIVSALPKGTIKTML